MTVRLYDENFGNMLMERDYPSSYLLHDGGIQECIIQLIPPYGNGFYHEISFANVHISFGNILLPKRLQLYLESDFDSVEMHFTLKGKSKAISGNFQKTVAFESYQHNIIYAHHMEGRMEFEGPEMRLFG